VGARPGNVAPAPDDPHAEPPPESPQNRVAHGIELAGDVTAEVVRSVTAIATRTAHNVGELSREAASQLPRIIRSEQIRPQTRVSLGLLVSERAQHDPHELLFLFDDRAYTAKDVDRRIDNVVRALISIGVRQGEHVGVLMGPRPSGLAVVAALNCGPTATRGSRRRSGRCGGSSPTPSVPHRPPARATSTRSCSAEAAGRATSGSR
jgi:putative long chain acyl-CoA synthase